MLNENIAYPHGLMLFKKKGQCLNRQFAELKIEKSISPEACGGFYLYQLHLTPHNVILLKN